MELLTTPKRFMVIDARVAAIARVSRVVLTLSFCLCLSILEMATLERVAAILPSLDPFLPNLGMPSKVFNQVPNGFGEPTSAWLKLQVVGRDRFPHPATESNGVLRAVTQTPSRFICGIPGSLGGGA